MKDVTEEKKGKRGKERKEKKRKDKIGNEKRREERR